MTDDIDTMVREVIEEAERLINTRTVWFVGRNMCGYMPECDVGVYDTWEAAKHGMISELMYVADSIDGYSPEDDDDEHAYAEGLIAAAADLTREDGPTWGDVISNDWCDYSWWINVETMDANEAQRLFDEEES